jgi:lactoylglutathione lyase
MVEEITPSPIWCAREDLNLHPLLDQILSLARLPFRHARNQFNASSLPDPTKADNFAVQVQAIALLASSELGYAFAMSIARKLLHTRYRVNDLERTVKFYKDVLGLQEVRRHKSPRGSELAFLKAPESEELIEICSFPNSGPVQVQADLTHLAFEVDSLAEFEEHLAKFGLKYSDGPTLKPDGSGFAFIDAPEGYEIELMQRARTGSGGGY